MSKPFPILKTTAIAAALLGTAAVSYGLYAVTTKLESINTALEHTQAKVSNQNLAKSMLEVIELHEQHKLDTAAQAMLDPWTLASNATDKRLYGSLNANFTLVEFSDLECPFCKRFHSTPKSLVDESKGLVNWEWKHLPLGFHNPSAEQGAYAAECVGILKGNQASWAFLDLYFRKSAGNGAGVDNLSDLAKTLGVDSASFNECMAGDEVKAKVSADKSLASRSGITGTPATYVVDNRTGQSILLGGAQPVDSFITTIKKLEEHYQSTLTKPDTEQPDKEAGADESSL